MKSKEEILSQLYISAKDLKVLIPSMNIETCRDLINEIRAEMENKNLYVPPSTKPKIALTKLVKERLGI